MFNHIDRSFRARASLVCGASALLALSACSKGDDDYGAPAPAASQALAVQAAIASAQAAHDHHALSMPEDDGAAAAMAPMAPTAVDAPSLDSAPMNMAPSAGSAPTGMARLLGEPPAAGAPARSGGGLPPALGAPHIYHLGAETFFLDQSNAIGLSSDQQKRLAALKESAAIAYATTQRKMDQGEQDLWVLSSSEAPDVAKIETKVGDIARLTAQQRMAFIRTVGDAVGVLSDTQRKLVAGQGTPMQPGTMAPAASASGMSMGGATPAPGGMEMGESKKRKGMGASGGMAPAGMGAAGMADAGASGGMGHM